MYVMILLGFLDGAFLISFFFSHGISGSQCFLGPMVQVTIKKTRCSVAFLFKSSIQERGEPFIV